jgi:hypothetical protein
MKRLKIAILIFIALSVSTFCMVRSGLMRMKTTEPNAPTDIVINFDTSQVTERVWYGTAAGGASGNVTIQALGDPPQVFRGTWAGATRWQIVAGNDSFVAEMEGKINTYNGVLVMRGRVINGANTVADVWAQGQVIAINPHRFVGTIRVIRP